MLATFLSNDYKRLFSNFYLNVYYICGLGGISSLCAYSSLTNELILPPQLVNFG